MKYVKLKLNAVFLLVFGLTALQAQESINVAGGNASGSGGLVTYSVGQLVHSYNTGTNGSLLQGIQLPYEVSTVTGLGDLIDRGITVTTYPNPVDDYLTLIVGEQDISNLSYQLYTINGKILMNSKITGVYTTISMCNLAPGTYFIDIISSNNKKESFKIIKN